MYKIYYFNGRIFIIFNKENKNGFENSIISNI